MYVLIRIFVNANSARLSTMLIISSPLIRQFSVVFYLEVISAITFFLGLFLLIGAIEKRRYSAYIIAGVAGH